MDPQAGSRPVLIVAGTSFSIPGGLKCLHVVLEGDHASKEPSKLKDGTLVDLYADPLRDTLWKLESAGGESCAAVPVSENRILAVMEAGQKKAVKKKLKKVKKKLQITFDRSADSIVDEGRLLECALDSVIRRGLQDHGWMSVGKLLVYGNLKAGVDRCSVDTVSLDVRLESKTQIGFVLKLGAARFRQFKFLEAVPEDMRPAFEEGKDVDLMSWIYSHSEDNLSDFECRVFPGLERGFVVGGCMNPPEGFSTDELRTLWLEKYGIRLLDKFAVLRVRFSFQPESKAVLYPSCCVLTAGGLVPVAPSIQNARAEPALMQLLKDIEACKFFGTGSLKVKRCEGGADDQGRPRLLGHAPLWTAVGGSKEFGKAVHFKGRPSNLVELEKLPVIRRQKPVLSRSNIGENGEEDAASKAVPDTDANVARAQATQGAANRPLIVPCFKPRSGSSKTVQVAGKGQTTSVSCPSRPITTLHKGPATSTGPIGGKLMAPSFGSRTKPLAASKTTSAKAAPVAKGLPAKAAARSAGTKASKAPGNDNQKAQESAKPPQAKRKKSEDGETGGSKKKQKTGSQAPDKEGQASGSTEGAAAETTPAQKAAPTEKAPRKRTTAADLDATEVDALVRSKFTESKLKDLSVPQMKNFLSQYKLKVGGKKEELLERISAFLKSSS